LRARTKRFSGGDKLMAGIGFALQRLTRRDDLLGILQGYSYSIFISAGPWLFTILALAGISIIGVQQTDAEVIMKFRIIIIYNFAFSLVFSGPTLLVATRYLADCVYAKTLQFVPGLMLSTLGIVFITGLLVVLPFYGFAVELGDPLRVAAISNFFLISMLWIITIFLSTLKNFISFSVIFLFGMSLALYGGIFLLGQGYGTVGLIWGFNIGLAVIVFTTVARTLAEYPYRIVQPLALLGYFRKYWELAVSGLAYNAAIWIDKWVMWFAPERQFATNIMVYHPTYDFSMFLAYLTIVPAMAMFTVSAETGFFKKYYSFIENIRNHAVYANIRKGHREIVWQLVKSSRNIIVLQGAISVIVLFTAPQLIELYRGSIQQLVMFRFGVLGAFFHVLVMFISVILAYFDLRRLNMTLHILFLVSNAVFTYASLQMGTPYYGYGYFLSAILTFLVGYLMLVYALTHLPYITFVSNNPSVR
jgi:uncharacterized membrane protein